MRALHRQINKLMVNHNIAFFSVDSAAPAMGESESSPPTTGYFQALRRVLESTLTVANVSKGGEENEPFAGTTALLPPLWHIITPSFAVLNEPRR